MLKSLLAVVLFIAASSLSAEAAERWTFCVGQSLDTRDVWISDVFAAATDRERLEGAFKAMLLHKGAARLVAQCPLPREDKTDVVNAQVVAEEFNRALGSTLHAVSTQAAQR